MPGRGRRAKTMGEAAASSAECIAAHHVFVCHSSLTVGVERSTVSLVRAVRATGARATVILPKPGPILELLDEIDGVEVVYSRAQWWMGTSGCRGAAKTAQALVQPLRWIPLIMRLCPTVVYVMSTVIPAPMIASRIVGAPLVVFLSESVRDNPDLVSLVPRKWIVRRVHKWASVTVAVSQYAAQQYAGATLVDVPEVINRAQIGAIRFRRERGPLRNVVMLGTLSKEKGQFDAVRATAVAISAGAELTLDLYGNAASADLSELNELIARHGLADVVHHRGLTAEPLEVLFAADLSLVCSGHEAYGRVTAESLAVGTPVLGYDAGGTAEILGPGGGVLVPVDVELLGAALARLGKDQHELRALVEAVARRQCDIQSFGDAAATIRRVTAALAIKPLPGRRLDRLRSRLRQVPN